MEVRPPQGDALSNDQRGIAPEKTSARRPWEWFPWDGRAAGTCTAKSHRPRGDESGLSCMSHTLPSTAGPVCPARRGASCAQREVCDAESYFLHQLRVPSVGVYDD